MLTKLLVIQKLSADGTVEIFQAYSDNFQWTFEPKRIATKTDKEYFPFTIIGNVKVAKRQPGPVQKIVVQRLISLFGSNC